MNNTRFVIFLLLFGYFCDLASGQSLPLPYYNHFDNLADTTGWSHYALNGTDDWELGIPSGSNLNSSFSPPNVWATNLNGNFSNNSIMCLETPFFDLSDTSKHYRLGFAHQIRAASYHGGNIEFSVDSGQTWLLLNGTSLQKIQWYNTSSTSGLGGQAAWTNNYYNSFKISYHSLDTVAGASHVKFRFQFGGTSNPGEGWVIDYFHIEESAPNIVAIQSQPYRVNKLCPTYDVNLSLVYSGLVLDPVDNHVKYYWSTDPIFDAADPLIGTKMQTIYGSQNWNKTFPLPPNLSAGNYYIFYQMDADSLLAEFNEADNLGMATLVVDSIYSIPFTVHFDDSTSSWEKSGMLDWQLEGGRSHLFDKAHSGKYAWSILDTGPYDVNALTSPYIDLSTEDSTVISFWYKLPDDMTTLPSYSSLRYSTGCDQPYSNISGIPMMRDHRWDFFNAYLPEGADTSDNALIRLFNGNGIFQNNGFDMMIDDIYVGQARADLSIELDQKNRFSSTAIPSHTLSYYLNNSGLRAALNSKTSFFWSQDSILDGTDQLLGTKQEPAMGDTMRLWTDFTFNKPTSVPGTYYIFYLLDSLDTVDEMREYNNKGYFVLHLDNPFSSPYLNDFESNIQGWRHNATFGQDDWEWTEPMGTVLDSAFSGTRGWITSDTGLVSAMSRMHLYTPVIDLSLAAHPVLEFDLMMDSHGSCNCPAGKMNMSYSLDGGATWLVLDTTNQSYNRWYYSMEYSAGRDRNYYIPNDSYLLFAPRERTFASYHQYNGRDSRRNTRYILDLTFLSGQTEVQFRFNLAAAENNPQITNGPVEGAFLDNFSIREAFVDLYVEDKKALMLSSIAEEVKFFIQIKNQGNYISQPTTVNYYLSADTILDGLDLLLGQDSIDAIRPDRYHYANLAFEGVDSLHQYAYLLFDLDEISTNQESNETNNLGFWPLALDSLHVFPYVNTFNDSIVDGWHQFSIAPYTSQIDLYRMRNMIAPGESLYQTDKESGEWATDRVVEGSWSNPPYFYLESPSFDFGTTDSVFLSFDMMCTGGTNAVNRSGGNFHYSIDGGNSWAILGDSSGQAHNWYNYSALNQLDNEPGWAFWPAGIATAVLDSTSIDLTFLRGEKHVKFRYKYRSNFFLYHSGSVQGLRIDNFHVHGYTVDYVANEQDVPTQAALNQASFLLDYSISNIGQSAGRPTKTRFYWSVDSVLDSNDSLLFVRDENPIASGTDLQSSITIFFPDSVAGIYYVFYVTDADSNLVETNESNNVGSYQVFLQSQTNFLAASTTDTIYSSLAIPTIDIPYSIINNGPANGLGSTTAFFWSSDSLFDAQDPMIFQAIEDTIPAGDTLASSIQFSYPIPILQSTYYVFFQVDEDDVIWESNETDNIGVTPIQFDYVNSVHMAALRSLHLYVDEQTLIIEAEGAIPRQVYALRMTNVQGQLIYQWEGELHSGTNRLPLPENISEGIYLFLLQNRHGLRTKKVLIHR